MHVTYACQNCGAAIHQQFDASSGALECPTCRQRIAIAAEAVEGLRVQRCLVCPSRELFVRKDFPQRLGVALVVAGIVGSSIAWYYASLSWTFGILFVTALADLLLFTLVGNALMCYRCGAQYRGVAEMESHGQFNLETHEKYRQISARSAAERPSGRPPAMSAERGH
jgi:DNA-directed RNA polymerase subunit RPC12/RpoP